MGVSIGVESILTSAARRPPNGPRLDDINRDKIEVVKTIERELGLHPLPWEEPSDRASATSASLGQSSYSSLTALPFTLDLDEVSPHLIDHDPFWTIYIPYDLERPRAFKGGPFGSYVVGSAPRLLAELERLHAPLAPAALGTLLRATREAVELRLPLHVRW